MIKLSESSILVFQIPTEKMKSLKPRADHRATLLLKWFKEKIVTKLSWLTFGAAVSSSMPCCADACRFKILKPPNCTRKYWPANTKCLSSCLKTQKTCWPTSWTLTPLKDLILIKSENTDGGMSHPQQSISPMESSLDITGFQSMMKSWKRQSNSDFSISSLKNASKLTGITTAQQLITCCLKDT